MMNKNIIKILPCLLRGLLILILFTSMKVGAHVPVAYTCCYDYTDSDGIQIDNFEYDAFSGIQLDNFENLSNWTILSGSQEADTINFKEGYQGLKLVTKNGNRAYSDKVINNDFSSSNNFAIWVYVYDINTFKGVQIYFTSTSNWSKYFYQGIFTGFKTGRNRLIFDKSSFKNYGGESWNNVMKKIRMASYPITGQNTNATLDDLRYDVENDWIGSSQEADTINFKEGQQGLKLVSINGNSAYIDLAINKSFKDVNNFAVWVYVNNASNYGSIYIYLTSTGSSWTKYFYDPVYDVKTGWNKLVFNKHSFKSNFGEDWNNVINRIRLRVSPPSGKDVNVTFDDLRNNMTGQRAKLMIEFDDGLYDVYSNAYPILNSNGQPGVSFVNPSRVGTSTYMNLTNLKILQSAGWDISSHTMNHVDLANADNSTQIYELNSSYDWLVDNNFQKSAGFIAYPFGDFNDNSIENVKKRYILGRSTAQESAQQHFTPDDESIEYIQKTVEALNTTTVQSIKDNINDTINAKLLGMLVFHGIVDSNPNTYQYLKTDLQAVSDYIKSRSQDVDVIAYSDYVIPNINKFTPVLNKTTRIYSNGSSFLIANNRYDEYMPNMTVKPSTGSVDINITTYNETGGIIKFNESSSDNDVQVSYEIGNRIPNQVYSIKIYWVNGTIYQDFNSLANSTGYIRYDSTGFGDARYQEINIQEMSVPLSITTLSPSTDPTTVYSQEQTFGITLNRTANVAWYMNGTQVQTNISVILANYTNSTADVGVWNVTAIATDNIDTVSISWNWTIIPQSLSTTYNVSGHIFDNYGSGLEGALVQNSSYQSTSDISGYYSITGIHNGTYNFSYSKAGFDIGYLEVVINGADNNSVNMTIYDNTPPSQILQYTINVSWNSVTDANYYEIFRNGTSIGYTKNTYWNDGFIPGTSYQYWIRANDTYNNLGENSSVLTVSYD